MNQTKQRLLWMGRLTLFFFLLIETVLFYAPDNHILRAICKGLASGAPTFFALTAYHRVRSHRNFFASLALLLCTAADIIINFHSITGMALFGLAHLLLCAAWLCSERPNRRQYLIYLVLAAAAAFCMFFLRTYLGSRLYPTFFYILILLAMVILGMRQDQMIRIGALTFAASDLLLAGNSLLHGTFFTHAVALAVYYAALCLITAGLWQKATVAERSPALSVHK